MRLNYHLMSVLLSLFVHRELFPLHLPVKVLKVLDGDTVEVEIFGKSERVRLAMIDAPELGQWSIDGKLEVGDYATECLKGLLSTHTTLKWMGRDRYQRVLGGLYEGQVDIQKEMLERGCVSVYGPTVHLCPECWRARERARRKLLGVWKHGGFMRPSQFRRWGKKKARTIRRAHILGRK